MSLLLPALLRHGFAVVRLPSGDGRALQSALRAWGMRGSFRHPPVPGVDDMENETNRRSENDDFPEERECFNALFARCRDS